MGWQAWLLQEESSKEEVKCLVSQTLSFPIQVVVMVTTPPAHAPLLSLVFSPTITRTKRKSDSVPTSGRPPKQFTALKSKQSRSLWKEKKGTGYVARERDTLCRGLDVPASPPKTRCPGGSQHLAHAD